MSKLKNEEGALKRGCSGEREREADERGGGTRVSLGCLDSSGLCLYNSLAGVGDLKLNTCIHLMRRKK